VPREPPDRSRRREPRPRDLRRTVRRLPRSRGNGGVGPRLAGAGLPSGLIQARIERGAGVMPAGLVTGAAEADVLAYVLEITSQK
jgi:hypothetical protein